MMEMTDLQVAQTVVDVLKRHGGRLTRPVLEIAVQPYVEVLGRSIHQVRRVTNGLEASGVLAVVEGAYELDARQKLSKSMGRLAAELDRRSRVKTLVAVVDSDGQKFAIWVDSLTQGSGYFTGGATFDKEETSAKLFDSWSDAAEAVLWASHLWKQEDVLQTSIRKVKTSNE